MRGTGQTLELGVVDISRLAREPDITLSATAAVSAALGSDRPQGSTYDLVSDIDCYIAVSTDPSVVTTSSGYPLLANTVVSFFVPAGEKIGAVAGGNGTLMIHRSK